MENKQNLRGKNIVKITFNDGHRSYTYEETSDNPLFIGDIDNIDNIDDIIDLSDIYDLKEVPVNTSYSCKSGCGCGCGCLVICLLLISSTLLGLVEFAQSAVQYITNLF